MGFSPRNGEIILKVAVQFRTFLNNLFQSPQWGDNSKGRPMNLDDAEYWFQSPQWGDNSKVNGEVLKYTKLEFQSPQWGDNSKGTNRVLTFNLSYVSVPAMGR